MTTIAENPWNNLERLEAAVDAIVAQQVARMRSRGATHCVCSECGCTESLERAAYNGQCSECGGDLEEVA